MRVCAAFFLKSARDTFVQKRKHPAMCVWTCVCVDVDVCVQNMHVCGDTSVTDHCICHTLFGMVLVSDEVLDLLGLV